jgi:3'(2'), 5'-bisphosphate nucleotidase|tara:strand:+ start:390 stop:1205 length:816 start_codon:yes stop_codon:yes gene_type:complete
MKDFELRVLVKKLLSILDLASLEVMKIYHSEDDGRQTKQDGSPVTKADLIANKIISEGLQELGLSVPILSEEDYSQQAKEEDTFWMVDPLDGTKEFINKNGEFTLNIALISKGSPILGVVAAPAVNEKYYGIPGFGSFKIKEGVEKKIESIKQGSDECKITLSKSHNSESDSKFIALSEEYFKSVIAIPAGSSLKLCRVAEGSANIYCRLGPTYQWDIAAGQAVAEGAGCCVKDLKGETLSYSFDPKKKNPYFYCSGDQFFDWKGILNNFE